MENHRSTSTIDRSGRAAIVPWESLDQHAPAAFIVAGASLLASLFVPFGLSTTFDSSWLVGITLVGFAVTTAALGLVGLHPHASATTPRLAVATTVIATIAGVAGLFVLGLTGLTGAAMHLPSLAFSVGKPAFLLLSLTMAAAYGLRFLGAGIGTVQSSSTPGRTGELLTAGGIVLPVPVLGGIIHLGLGIALPAWVVFASLALIAADTVAVGISLRSTG